MRNGILSKLLVLTIVLSSHSFACDEHGITGIVEENKMYIPVSESSSLTGITEEEFNLAIDKVEAIYAPIIAARGKTLTVERNWTDGTVNAYARQQGNTWFVAMFGGLARHETITLDGFATVICHEVGHHIGGAPKKASWWSSSWASNEGQADYFGTSKCLRKYMEQDDNIAMMSKVEIPELVTKKCQENFSNEGEIAMCQRGAMAGMSLANLFRALRKLPTELKYDTPDTKVVTKTNDSHPAPQCRLDTYFQGALCEKSAYDDVSRTDALIGTCNRVDGMTDGIRPLCWYKPSTASL